MNRGAEDGRAVRVVPDTAEADEPVAVAERRQPADRPPERHLDEIDGRVEEDDGAAEHGRRPDEAGGASGPGEDPGRAGEREGDAADEGQDGAERRRGVRGGRRDACPEQRIRAEAEQQQFDAAESGEVAAVPRRDDEEDEREDAENRVLSALERERCAAVRVRGGRVVDAKRVAIRVVQHRDDRSREHNRRHSRHPQCRVQRRGRRASALRRGPRLESLFLQPRDGSAPSRASCRRLALSATRATRRRGKRRASALPSASTRTRLPDLGRAR